MNKRHFTKIISIVLVLICGFLCLNTTYPASAVTDCKVYEPYSKEYNECMAKKGNYDSSKLSPSESEDKSDTSSSESDSCRYFLGMVSWDCHTSFTNGKDVSTETLKKDIWTSVANVVTDVTVIAAYLIVGYVIYGGYLYIFAAGDPGKAASGKKTLTHAFIGLAIVMTANIILNSIRIALVGSSGSFVENCTNSQCVNPGIMVIRTIQWVIGIAGAVAAIFVVYGGISYTISAGDPGKLKKAKDVILYAVIGLIICALAQTITAFVADMIRQAQASATTNTNTYISLINSKGDK